MMTWSKTLNTNMPSIIPAFSQVDLAAANTDEGKGKFLTPYNAKFLRDLIFTVFADQRSSNENC